MTDKITELEIRQMRKRICKRIQNPEKKNKRKALQKPDPRQMTIFEIIDKAA